MDLKFIIVLNMVEKSQSYALTIRKKPVDHYERSLDHLQLAGTS